jgi:tRNA(Ile)-lysidine synthetase-like protein
VIPTPSEIPPGPWAVAVSGGADSIALLLLLKSRPNLSLHIVHLDHQTRAEASTGDAQFVANLARQLSLPFTIARRDEIEPKLENLPKNLSARFRALRIEIFRQTVAREKLFGVILAHQADDQAETILLRLLRGSGPAGLSAMSFRRRLGDLIILRPLLNIRRADLRSFLTAENQPWREDASNQSDHYARNRIRKFLESHPDLHEPLLALGRACVDYSKWIRKNAPTLQEKFPAIALAEFPRILARESARRWLELQGVPPSKLTPAILDRLRKIATDAATPARQQFPGGVRIHRRSGWISRDQ